jgi:hypothetical protein
MEALLSQLAAALAPLEQVQVAWLFGSRATGRARPDCDLAFHVVASEGWTPPSSGRGAFASLAAHGRLDPALAGRLGLAYGLRNLLVHDYADVDLVQLAEAVRCAHVDLRAFAATFASPPPAP